MTTGDSADDKFVFTKNLLPNSSFQGSFYKRCIAFEMKVMFTVIDRHKYEKPASKQKENKNGTTNIVTEDKLRHL